MNKKDFKYIIKRILIGVGIVFCIGFLNKCSVKAQSLDICLSSNSITCDSSQTFTNFSFNSPYSNNVYNFNSSSEGTIPYLVFYDSITDSYYSLFISQTSLNPYYDPFDIKLQRDEIDSSVVWYSYKCIDSTSEYCTIGEYVRIGGWQNTFVLSNSNSLNTSLWGSSFSINVLNSPIQNEYFYTTLSNSTLSSNFIYDNYEDFTVYSTNLSSFSIENFEIDLNPIPSYFTEIDMQQHAGVYFVPKDYSTLQTVLNSQGQRVYVFNYYYQGKFSEGYFPLSDYGKIVFFYYDYTSRDNKSYNSSWFPFSVTEDSTTYDYFAFIIENDDYGSLNQHLPSYIYYDSRYFDYYFIDDFFDYNENISYIDKSGNTVSSDVSITDSLRSLYKQGFQNRQSVESIAESMIHSLDNNVLGQYLEFITIPFNFLWSFTNTTCEPITLPIPFVNSEITLPCLSSVFEEHVPALKNIIFIVVNGFLVFRITMRNIDTVTDVLKADDDKIEVVDL